MSKFARHVFVCLNERAAGSPKGCCASKGALAVFNELKKSAYDQGLKGVVRINRAGCLDACEEGVSVVVYPEAVWYAGVTVQDVPDLVQGHLIGGVAVERLRSKSPPKVVSAPSEAP